MNHFSHIPNPRKIGHSEFEIGLTETGLPTFCNHLTSYRNNRDCFFGLTEIDKLLSWLKSVSPRLHFRSNRNWHVPVFTQIGLTKFSFSVPPKTPTFISLALSVSPRWYFRSHRKPQRSLYLNFRSDRVFTSVSPRLFNYVCNGWILCGGYIYPLHPLFIRRESHQKVYHSYYTLSEKRTTYPCVEIKSFHSYHMKLDF